MNAQIYCFVQACQTECDGDEIFFETAGTAEDGIMGEGKKNTEYKIGGKRKTQGAVNLKIRNPKHEISGPDLANIDTLLRS